MAATSTSSLRTAAELPTPSLDHVFIDEAKFIDWEQLNNETLPANRGNKQLFGGCCLHHGLTITSDTSATKKVPGL